MAKTDIAQIAFDEIKKNLDNPGIWDNGRINTFFPTNPVSGKPYRGINVLNLGLATMANNWQIPHFMTFNQAKQVGGSVNKGAKSSVVVFWKMLKTKDRNTGEDTRIPLLRYYRVFNVEQISGLPEKYTKVEESEAERIVEADVLVDAYMERETDLDIVSTFTSPYYSPGKDVIGMPEMDSYKTGSRYYESLFHEMVHSTGHHSRLNRPFENGFGSEGYSREELVAEFGAAMLMTRTGSVEGYRNLASYIKNWWKRLGENPKDLVVASGRAQKAVEYVENGKKAEVPEEKAA